MIHYKLVCNQFSRRHFFVRKKHDIFFELLDLCQIFSRINSSDLAIGIRSRHTCLFQDKQIKPYETGSIRNLFANRERGGNRKISVQIVTD